MNLSIGKVQEVYAEKDLVTLIKKSIPFAIAFAIRNVKHYMGMRGLYRSNQYLKLLYWLNAGYGRYDALADPYKIVSVDPREIEYVTGRGPNPGRFQWQDIGTIQGGDWDKNDKLVEELPVVKAVRERFERGKSWEEIEFINHVKEQARRGNVVWRGCENTADVDAACEYVDSLYAQIKNRGYKSKRELIQEGNEIRSKDDPRYRFETYNEVAIDVGRDGQVLFVDGRHRLTIAKILDINEIPVRISARHKHWQKIREIIAKADESKYRHSLIKAHSDHIDLIDIHEKST